MDLETLILAAAQFIWPFLIGKWPALASVPKKLVPIINFALALVVKLVGPEDAQAGLFGLSAKGLLDIVVEAATQTLLVTGVHSSGKNLWQNLLGASIKRARR